MTYTQGQRVEDMVTGSHGTVIEDQGGEVVNVSWDPNEHGGYISDHPREAVVPLEN